MTKDTGVVGQVTEVVGSELLDIMAETAGGLLGSGHTWVGPVDTPSAGTSISSESTPLDNAQLSLPSQSSSNGMNDTSAMGRGKDAASLEAEILTLVHRFVGANVSAHQPLAAQGLDSLAAMELRQKLQVSGDCMLRLPSSVTRGASVHLMGIL